MRQVIIAILAAILLCSHIAAAQDYSECRALCDRDLADCNSEPQASEPEEQTAKEAKCSEKAQSCYAKCESLKQPTNDNPSETNSGTPSETNPGTPPETGAPPEATPVTPDSPPPQETPPDTTPEANAGATVVPSGR